MSGVVFVLAAVSGLLALWPSSSTQVVLASERSPRSKTSSAMTPVVVAVSAIVIGLAVNPLIGLVSGAGWPLTRWWRHRVKAAERERALVLAQPVAIDLVGAVLGAGGTIPQAIALLGVHGPPVLAPAVRRVEERRGAGHGFAAASAAFVEEAGSSYQTFMRALVATERDGAPVATLLERLAVEGRTARSRELDARSKRLPLLLLGPLALCSLPAVFVGAVIPLVLVALGDLGVG